MTSQKQTQANRRNAKKSTGPRTGEGKDIAKLNAMQHGILSNHVFVHGHDDTEYTDFAALRDTFFEEMQPVGVIETLLVDRLFATHWRMKRLHIAETGMIEKQTSSAFVHRILSVIEENSLSRQDVERGFFRRLRTSIGCSQLADGWKAVAEHIKEHGLPLPPGMTRGLDEELGGRSGYWKAEAVSVSSYAFENREQKPMDEEEEREVLQWALQFAEELEDFFRGTSQVLEWDEETMRKADLHSKMIPPLDQLDKLQRYDAHLQRLFMQTLHELQRVQAARCGGPAPLPAALDVTLNSENGFVS